MIKKKLVVLMIFWSLFVFGQVKKDHYQEFNLSFPLRGNDSYGQVDSNGNRSDFWFLPDGLSLKYGVGVFQKKWFGLGMHSGLNWIVEDKIVTIPVFVNIRLSPKVGPETQLYFQGGYGKSIPIGRGSLMGDYKKISFGFGNSEGIIVFAELEDHGYSLGKNGAVMSFSLGISFITF